MKFIFSILFFTNCFILSSQNISQINKDLHLGDVLNENEIRIYRGFGTTNDTSLLRMYKTKKEKWIIEIHKHYAKIKGVTDLITDKKYLFSENEMEYIFLNLIKNHILDLPNLKEINWKLSKNEVKKTKTRIRGKVIEKYELIGSQISVLDGIDYKIQINAWNRTNEFSFSNVEKYLKNYPEVDELIFMKNIIQIIKNEFHIWNN